MSTFARNSGNTGWKPTPASASIEARECCATTISRTGKFISRYLLAAKGAFVEYLRANIPDLEFFVAVARTHGHMLAAVSKAKTAGAHDALIAATAIHHGYALLTRNVADFRIFPGLNVEAFAEPA